MKEFEKQFSKMYPLPPTIERGPVGRGFKRGCENMWRGALEMVQNWHKEARGGFEPDLGLREMLKKELEK